MNFVWGNFCAIGKLSLSSMQWSSFQKNMRISIFEHFGSSWTSLSVLDPLGSPIVPQPPSRFHCEGGELSKWGPTPTWNDSHVGDNPNDIHFLHSRALGFTPLCLRGFTLPLNICTVCYFILCVAMHSLWLYSPILTIALLLESSPRLLFPNMDGKPYSFSRRTTKPNIYFRSFLASNLEEQKNTRTNTLTTSKFG